MAPTGGDARRDIVHEEWTDEKLYKGLVAREARALEALIRRYSREMSYFIRIVLEGVGTLQDAEECANDLFIAAWREIDSYDPARASLRTWMTMRAKYIALDKRRQVQRRHVGVISLDGGERRKSSGESATQEIPALYLSDNSMEGLVEQQERREELDRALNELNALDRRLVLMRYFQLTPTEQICAETGLTRQAIDTRLWRARKALRDALGGHSHERVRPVRKL
jgi:RNA polymerase sigma-70 factor (ECF subfamily)